MGVYVKGITPAEILAIFDKAGACKDKNGNFYVCVVVHEPHGRLIDADALNLDYEVNMADDWKTAHEIANCVRYAPTVIEAEGEDVSD